MKPRLEIATQIYQHLVMRDLPKSIRRPGEMAHMALLFADALLRHDDPSMPPDLPDENDECFVKPLREDRPELAEALKKRRTSGRTVN